jgi:hypothetical protein
MGLQSHQFAGCLHSVDGRPKICEERTSDNQVRIHGSLISLRSSVPGIYYQLTYPRFHFGQSIRYHTMPCIPDDKLWNTNEKGLDRKPRYQIALPHVWIHLRSNGAANGSPKIPMSTISSTSRSNALRETKKAFRDGFRVLVFEGQLVNLKMDCTEYLVLAFHLAKMGHRPIRLW